MPVSERLRAYAAIGAQRASARAGYRIGTLVGAATRSQTVPPSFRTPTARRLGMLAMSAGASRFLDGLLAAWAHGDDDLRRFGHDLAVSIGDTDRARRIAETPGSTRWSSRANQVALAAERMIADGDAARARDVLEDPESPTSDELDVIHRRTLAATGSALALLEADDAEPGSVSQRFAASWLLGDAEGARQAADEMLDGSGLDAEVFGRVIRAYEATGASSADAARRIDDAVRRRGVDDDLPVVADFVLGRLDELVERGEDVDAMGPRGRYLLAATHYVRRDFAASRSVAQRVLGTMHHWDAEKLLDRILLEEGHAAEAVARRRPRSRLRPVLDEVEYFGLLHLGHLDEAFRRYLQPKEAKRLRSTFGESAEFLPTEHVGRRFVITQNGPGDEVANAATYSRLLELSDELTVASDPRLASLMQRSFPDVDVVATPRQSSRPEFGFLAPDRPARATGNMYDLLTEAAAESARAADRVVLGRSLPRLTPTDAPYEPYLRPDHELVRRIRARLPRPAIGVVWRSEYVDPMRSIHFVRPGDLAPLAALDGGFVCLQHDATDAERSTLVDALDGRVTFLDDVDLRDDFESAAAVVAACTTVVGVGTTMTELAAAVGTPTVYLHPNNIGAWRHGENDRDHWHREMRAAVTDDPRRPGRCVERAAELLAAHLPVQDRATDHGGDLVGGQ